MMHPLTRIRQHLTQFTLSLLLQMRQRPHLARIFHFLERICDPIVCWRQHHHQFADSCRRSRTCRHRPGCCRPVWLAGRGSELNESQSRSRQRLPQKMSQLLDCLHRCLLAAAAPGIASHPSSSDRPPFYLLSQPSELAWLAESEFHSLQKPTCSSLVLWLVLGAF